MIIRLTAPIPSKKNSRLVVGRGRGRALNIPSEQYREWHKANLGSVRAQLAGLPLPAAPVELRLRIYLADRRRRDLDNALSSVLDLLVDSGALKDDSWAVVPRMQIEACLVSEEPSAVVEMAEIPPNI